MCKFLIFHYLNTFDLFAFKSLDQYLIILNELSIILADLNDIKLLYLSVLILVLNLFSSFRFNLINLFAFF